MSKVIHNIQFLRAVAAMLVVIVHASAILSQQDINTGWAQAGHGGVDLFFVISGFIMVWSTRPETRPVDFMINRVERVVPLYFLVTLTVFGLALLAPSLFQSTQAELIYLVKSLLFIPFERADGMIQPIVFVGWTLNYEMAFYAIFAASLALRFKSAQQVKRVFSVILVLVLIASFYPFVDGPIARFYTDPLILEFAVGMLIGLIVRLNKPIAFGGTAIISGVIIAVLLHPTDLQRAIRFGIPAALIVYGAIALEYQGRTIRRFRLLGDASYSIYLTHFFVTQIVAKISGAKGDDPLMAWLFFGLAIIGSAVVGVMVHKFIERPATNKIRRQTSLA